MCLCVPAEAESAYNLGRAAHRIGLLHVAVAHYERVLQLADEADAHAAADGAAQQLQGLSVQPPPQQQQQLQDGADAMQVRQPESPTVGAPPLQEDLFPSCCKVLSAAGSVFTCLLLQ